MDNRVLCSKHDRIHKFRKVPQKEHQHYNIWKKELNSSKIKTWQNKEGKYGRIQKKIKDSTRAERNKHGDIDLNNAPLVSLS